MKRLLLILPLAAFVLIMITVGLGLRRPEQPTQQSRLIGRAVPDFSAPAMLPGRAGVSSSALAAKEPKLLNVFASWCVPCAAEAPSLLALERRGVRIEALAIRDKPDDVARFLTEHGDPFAGIGDDRNSQAQLALGSAGVPETFVIDGRGTIRFQHIGPLLPRDVPTILQALEAAR